MNQSPQYKYRIIKNEYLSGFVSYSAQKAPEKRFFKFGYRYSNLTSDGFKDTYETTLENAMLILEWHIKTDLYWYKRLTLKSQKEVKL
jgi:hypothetical protein